MELVVVLIICCFFYIYISNKDSYVISGIELKCNKTKSLKVVRFLKFISIGVLIFFQAIGMTTFPIKLFYIFMVMVLSSVIIFEDILVIQTIINAQDYTEFEKNIVKSKRFGRILGSILWVIILIFLLLHNVTLIE